MFVMAWLVPAIHAFLALIAARTWMPGTSPGMTRKERQRRASRTMQARERADIHHINGVFATDIMGSALKVRDQ
jgi:hypothetical protein